MNRTLEEGAFGFLLAILTKDEEIQNNHSLPISLTFTMERKTLENQLNPFPNYSGWQLLSYIWRKNVFISKIIHSLSNTLKSSFSEKNQALADWLDSRGRNIIKYQANILQNAKNLTLTQ